MYMSDKGNLTHAIRLAALHHHGQLDKAGKPYILHPLYVMMQMETEDEQIVAVLHDLIEDTSFSKDDLYANFTTTIYFAVMAMTKKPGEKYTDYLRRVKDNKIATKVKIQDMLHNSSEERLKVLDEDEAEYLRNKYKKGLEFLGYVPKTN